MFRRTALLATTIGAAMVMATATAVASTGPVYYSPDQAGYAATGAHFKVAEVHVTLPYASRFAHELGSVGFGVQLWSASTVVDLRVQACTDYTCKPGGTPVVRRYRPVLRVFSRSTRSLICSTLNGTCPDVPSSWKNARFAPGKSVDISLEYDEPDIPELSAGVGAGSSGAGYNTFVLGTRLIYFSQARIGAEFGITPWSTVAFRHPSNQLMLAKLWEPSTAPFEAELATYGGSSGCIGGWWTRHIVKMTRDGSSSGTVETRPGGLWNHGCDFRVYLEP